MAPTPTLLLVKPPERSRFSFGAFSLAVLAAAVRDLARVAILDASELTPAQALREISDARPDWIGITTMALASLAPAAQLIRALRQRLPRARILVGGHGASMLPRPVLEAGADAVIRGEGELALRAVLADGLADHSADALVPAGAVRLRGGELVQGEMPPLVVPLDRLSAPALDLLPAPAGGVHLLETSRGCPHDCGFCETTRFYGRRWRWRTPVRVAADIRGLVTDQAAWLIEITDDNFAASRRRVRQICALLEDVDLPACILVSARADDLLADPELLPAMARARMLRVSVGVETLSDELGQRSGKAIGLDAYRTLFARMRELGMFSVASFIIGLPGETPRQRAEAVELARAAAPDAARFLPFYPFPGIPLAAGRDSYDPDPADTAMAARCTDAFYGAPEVHERLQRIASGDDIGAMLARGTLARNADAAMAG